MRQRTMLLVGTGAKALGAKRHTIHSLRVIAHLN